jgi:hypothetical protein
MCAARDLQTQAVALKLVPGRPEIEGDTLRVTFDLWPAGLDALEGLADIDGFALLIHSAEASEEMGLSLRE